MQLLTRLLLSAFLLISSSFLYSQSTVHVWEMQEITLNSKNVYNNPYTEVKVWVDLQGPGFNKRVYGFWDGNNTFKVRVTAMQPGKWSWTSGSNKSDTGLNNKKGSFDAV